MEYIHSAHSCSTSLSVMFISPILPQSCAPSESLTLFFLGMFFFPFANDLCHVGVDWSYFCIFRNLSFSANHKWKQEGIGWFNGTGLAL